ncbi:hypothetical protein CAL29_04070 [Bordetella genomosp. 10]|uniref:Iron dicitrate transport regulator FecR n=1 Tax=Bordetella genomosp. 10 TaxID=1416804 RepID=A0A261SKQ6_9BORD|nr:FecR domain-containing protein [Bordetella genomosp. 10]OZI37587.1 hypothetical protein CAL29_04070 [Bordetella genomosp. 10]
MKPAALKLPQGAGGAVDFDSMRQAADWYALLTSDAAGEDDRRDWQAWLAQSTAHRQAWAGVESINRQFVMLTGSGAARQATASALDAGQVSARRRRRMLRGLLVAGGVFGLAAGAGRIAPVRRLIAGLRADQQTALGEIRELTLPDGSLAWLNTASALQVRYDDSVRRIVLLYGEVLIRTAPDARRPMLVETGQGVLRPLGTRFDVRQEEDAATRLAVLEGRVEVRLHAGGGAPRVIEAGQQVRFDSRMGPVEPAPPGLDAWRRNMLLADDMTLGSMTETLARYRVGILGCDPRVADLRVTGGYPLSDTDQALRMLAAALPVRIRSPLPWWTLIEPR